MLRGLLWGLGVLLVAIGAFWLWVVWPIGGEPKIPVSPGTLAAAPPQHVPSLDPPSAPLVGGPPETCEGTGAPLGAATANAFTLSTLPWQPFGKLEIGWEIYAPRIAAEIGTTCAPDTDGFASALARWQGKHAVQQSGLLSQATFSAMLTGWHLARPFVRMNRDGMCPAAPSLADLAQAEPRESYGGKAILLRPGALDSYHRMVAAAKEAGVLTKPETLTIFSGFRAPDADAQRCARDKNCQGLTRTICSAHRTGLAMDVVIDSAPGFGPDSSADANRLAMSRSPLYRWMVVNAGQFGFVNYAYEPWHWEWTGEALLPGVPISSLPQEGSEPVVTEPAKEPQAAPISGKPVADAGARNRR